MNNPKHLFATLVMLNVFWSPVNFCVNTAIHGGLSPAGIALTRWGSLCVLLFALLRTKWFANLTGAKWPTLRQALGAMVVGVFLFAPAHVLYYTSLARTSTVVGTVINSTALMWVALFSFLILREKLTIFRKIAIGLGTVGCYIVAVGFERPDLGQGDTASNLCFMLGTICECLGGVIATRLVRQSSGITILAFQILGGLITFALVPFLIPDRYGLAFPSHFSFSVVASIGYLTLIPGLICWGWWYVIAEKTPLSLMVVTTLIQPLVGAAIGYFLAGEPITTQIVAGSVSIIAALLVVAREPLLTHGEHVACAEH